MKIIKDRHARSENKPNFGVPQTRFTQEDMRGKENKGLTMEEINGQPAEEKRGATGGVPSFMPSPLPEPITTPTCTQTTLKGKACRAYPVTGTENCIGHARQ